MCWWSRQGSYDKYSFRDSIFTPEIVWEAVQCRKSLDSAINSQGLTCKSVIHYLQGNVDKLPKFFQTHFHPYLAELSGGL